MNKRFEIPVEPPRYNTFLVDDYLRSLRSHEERIKLINTWGYSAEKREEYEKASGLPHGAVELALVCEDKQISQFTAMVGERMKKLYDEKASPEKVKAALNEFDVRSRSAGFQALYPDAFQFLMQYSGLSRRSAASFRGDYSFNNEYKITLADCSPSANANANASGPCGDSTPGNWCNYINVAIVVNIAAAVQLYIAVLFYFIAGVYIIGGISVLVVVFVL